MSNSASKLFKKASYLIGSSLQKPSLREKAAEQAAEQVVERTEAQTGADTARKRRRSGRVGQRGLLYASRLGGGGAGRGEDQNTLGSA